MKHTLSALVLLAGLAAAAAQSAAGAPVAGPLTLTVEQAVELALQNNIQLSSSTIDLRIKQRAWQTSWKVFIPNVQASGTLARTNMNEMMMGSTLVQLEEKERWSAMGSLGASLNLSLALVEGLRATRQSYEAGRISWDQARFETEQNVRMAFYGILLQEGSLALSRDMLAVGEERVRQARTNYLNGLIPELTFLRAQLQVESQKPEIQKAEQELARQKEMFAFLLGLEPGTEVELSGSITARQLDLDAAALVNGRLANRFDIASLAKNIELMRTQVRATALQLYTPALVLNQTWSPRLSGIDDNWLEKDNWKDSSGAFSVTLAFNLTALLPFSSQGQSLRELKDTVRKMELTMQQAARMGETEIRTLVNTLERSRVSMEVLQRSVELAEKAWRLTEQGYRAGTVEYLDLKDAENSLHQAKLGLLVEQFNYTTTLLNLEKAVGGKLTQQ